MDFADIADDVGAAHSLVPVVQAIVPGRRIHIDADMLAYQCGGNEDTTVAKAREKLNRMVEDFRVAAGAEHAVLHLTGEGSDKGKRALVAYTKPYQGQRKGHKPTHWKYIRDYIGFGHAGKVKQWYDREADDGFGYISEHCPGDVICSRDKDMRMLPGYHLDWDTLVLYHVPPEQFAVVHGGKLYGHKWFWTQMLWGDGADNIPGLPKHPDYPKGVGEVSAGKMLAFAEDDQSACHIVQQAYRQHWGDGWEDRFVEQASLLWIRRSNGSYINDWLVYLPHTDALAEAAKRQVDRVSALELEAERINACQSD